MGKEAIREKDKVKTSIASNLLIRLMIINEIKLESTEENEFMFLVGPPGFEPGITRDPVAVGFALVVAHGGSPSRAS